MYIFKTLLKHYCAVWVNYHFSAVRQNEIVIPANALSLKLPTSGFMSQIEWFRDSVQIDLGRCLVQIYNVQKRSYQILIVCSTRENNPKSLNKQYSKNHLFLNYKPFFTANVRCALQSFQHKIWHAFSLQIEHHLKIPDLFRICCFNFL